MHITEWEASRSGAGITVAMTDAGGVRHKQFVKKIEAKGADHRRDRGRRRALRPHAQQPRNLGRGRDHRRRAAQSRRHRVFPGRHWSRGAGQEDQNARRLLSRPARMTPVDRQRARLQAACDFVAASLRMGMEAGEIIDRLCSGYDGKLSVRYDGNKLRVAGVAASCTWSADAGLLENWRKTATVRLMESA
jgi:hypothetical protein